MGKTRSMAALWNAAYEIRALKEKNNFFGVITMKVNHQEMSLLLDTYPERRPFNMLCGVPVKLAA